MVRLFIERIRTAEGRKLFATFFVGEARRDSAALRRLQGVRVLPRRPGLGSRAQGHGRRARPDQPDQHGVGAGRRVPRVLHAGRLRDARGRLRPDRGRRSTSSSECIVDTCLCGVLFWAFGLRLHVRDRQRLHRPPVLLPERRAPAPTARPASPFLAFLLFQFAFADTCSTITSGAMVGRTGFIGDILYSIGVIGLHLPDHRPLGLGPGRLARPRWQHAVPRLRRLDGRAHHRRRRSPSPARIALGPRLGRVFKRDGGGPMPAARHHLGAVGGVILWFGWYGFNPGSHAVGAWTSQGIGRVAANTTLAACAGGLAALFFVYPRIEEVGPRHHGQRLPRRPGRHHLPRATG